MTTNILRCGNFTDSEIVALTKLGQRLMTDDEAREYKQKNPKSQKRLIEDATLFSDAGMSYINEKNMERRLGRSIHTETIARPTTYGKFMEPVVFDKLPGIEYNLSSEQTTPHTDFDFWAGSHDGLKFDPGGTNFDFKNPATLKSFCNLVDPLYEGLYGIEAFNAIRFGWTDKNGFYREPHPDGEKFWWQLVGGSCRNKTKYSELIIHCPFESEIPELHLRAVESGLPEYYFIAMAGPEELPYIKDDGYYKDVNIIRFEVPQADKDFLTQRVIAASKYLIPRL